MHILGPSPTLACNFVMATETELTCKSGQTAHTVARSDIRAVKVSHRGRSTLVGLGIGVASGAIAGVATCKGDTFFGPGSCAAILGIPAGVIGAGIGAATDFTHATIQNTH